MTKRPSCTHSCFIQALKYKEELLDLLKYLYKKTLSKRGFSSTGKLLASTLLTLTHTYPLENKFVNPDEWNSSGRYLLFPSRLGSQWSYSVQKRSSSSLGQAVRSRGHRGNEVLVFMAFVLNTGRYPGMCLTTTKLSSLSRSLRR